MNRMSMNTAKKLSGLVFFILALLNNSSCRKPDVPDVITAEVSEVTKTYATSGGTVLDDGNAYVTDSGICWSTSENPTLLDNYASCCEGMGSFILRMMELLPGTVYFVRAYATNSAGTGYGNQVSFKTADTEPAGVVTIPVKQIGLTSASSGGYVYNNGGGAASSQGVCWSTSQEPTILDSKTDEGPGDIQEYSSRLTGLVPGAKYYVRAYVTNIAGTSYGYPVSFSTLSVNPPGFNPDLTYGTITDIDGNNYRTIQIGDQTWMAENLKTTRLNDGTLIRLVTSESEWESESAAAICWYESDSEIYKDLFGGYYNRYAVNTEKLCPVGWHVPDKADWSELITHLGGTSAAGGKMKEHGSVHWLLPNRGATNQSGFTGMAGGCRKKGFIQIGEIAYWWSASSSTSYWSVNYHDFYVINYIDATIRLNGTTEFTMGSNVRCIMD